MKLRAGLAWALLLLCWGAGPATAKIDMRPKVALLVGEAGQVFARKGVDAVASYRLDTGELLHTFPFGGYVSGVDVSPDGRYVVCVGDGRVTAWDGRTGVQLWDQKMNEGSPTPGIDLRFRDLSFAGDGESFVLCQYDGPTLVFETRSGRRVRVMNNPPPADYVMSAALDPSGTRGVAVDRGKRLYTFEVASGAVTDTGVQAAWPVRYSSDGRHVACRSDDSEGGGFLRVVDLGEPLSWKDVEELAVDHLRPSLDGTFLVRGHRWTVGEFGHKNATSVGLVCVPRTGKVRERWEGVRWIDFDPKLKIGAVTLSTTTDVYDLGTGEVRLRINGGAGHRRGGDDFFPLACGAGALACCVAVAALLLVRRRGKSPPALPARGSSP